MIYMSTFADQINVYLYICKFMFTCMLMVYKAHIYAVTFWRSSLFLKSICVLELMIVVIGLGA